MQPTIFITGAAGGFGQATARLFRSKGYFIGLYDLTTGPLAALRQELGEENCCFSQLDVTDHESCRAALTHFLTATGGRLNILLNNAGIMVVGAFEELDIERQLKVLDVNLNGMIRLTHLAFPSLRDTPNSQVINIASASALHGNPELVTYATSKRAVQSFTEALDIGWEQYGIRVSDINPMYARTNMVASNQHLLKKLPDTQVKLTPADVAEAIYATSRGGKVHRYVGTDAKVFSITGGWVPFGVKRWLLKQVIGY